MLCTEPILISILVAILQLHDMTIFLTSSSTAMFADISNGIFSTDVLLLNFLHHSYTCCRGREESPYCTFIQWQISEGFIPSLLKKLITLLSALMWYVSSMEQFIFELLLCVVLLHHAANCFIFWPQVQTYVFMDHKVCNGHYNVPMDLRTLQWPQVPNTVANLQSLVPLFFLYLSHF